jgi:tetratricopeptide (TPR) repeat protein
MPIHPSVPQLAKRLVYFLPIPGVVAAATYLLTLSHTVCPGLSAAFTAEAMGVIPPSEASRPIFALVTRGVASIDLFSMPVRLNLLSALCGTLCAMLLYHLVSRMILFVACADSGRGSHTYSYEMDPEGVSWLRPDVEAYNRLLLPIAIIGGWGAAGLFIFMVPVWLAATRLDHGLFVLLLALASLSVFPVDATAYRWLRLACSVGLFVLGLFNSAVFLLLLPCYAVFLFRAVRDSDNRFVAIGWLVLAGMVGSALAVYAYAQNSADAAGSSLLRILIAYARALPTNHYNELMSFFPRSGWLLVLVQAGVPGLILLFGKKTLLNERRGHTTAALLVVTLAALPGLLNLSIAPYFLFQPILHLPVFGSALLAVVTAMALTTCLLLILPDDSSREDVVEITDLEMHPSRGSRFLRGLVRVLLPIFVLLVLVVPWRNFHETTRRSVFADETARAILDQMKGRTWLISNGYLDNHLLIQAALLKQPLTLVTPRPQTPPTEAARLKRIIATSPHFEGQNRQRLQNALSLGAVRFVREWFMTDPEVGRRAMVLAAPDLWTACGYVAVPEGLAFGGIRSGQKPDLTSLVEANRVFAGRVLPLLLVKDEGSGYVAALSETLRMNMGRSANELGVLLEEQGQAVAAYQAYSQASQIDPKNISAVVNGYLLASAQKMDPAEISRLSKTIKELTKNRKINTHDLTGIIQNYGTIPQQEIYRQQAKLWSSLGARSVAADKNLKALALSEQTGVNALIETASASVQAGDFVQAESCFVSAMKQDPANRAALSGMSLLSLNQNKTEEAGKWIQKALEAGVERDTLLYPIITLAILKRDTNRALTLLTEATQKFPTDLRFWTLQADILLEQGDTELVEKTVLPQMQKALKNPDHVLVYAVRGFLLKKKGPAFFAEARRSLLTALSINAAMPDLWKTLFELDVAIGNPDFTEADARNLLNVDPDHALANYLMGSLLLSRGKLQESEDFLRRSIDKKVTSAACNALSENLRRQEKPEEAEAFAKRALAID